MRTSDFYDVSNGIGNSPQGKILGLDGSKEGIFWTFYGIHPDNVRTFADIEKYGINKYKPHNLAQHDLYLLVPILQDYEQSHQRATESTPATPIS